MINDVLDYLRHSPPHTKVYVGCDSSVNRNRKTKEASIKYVTVVILHTRDWAGPTKIFWDVKIEQLVPMKHRLIKECYYAMEKVIEILPHLDGRDIEVHFDYNSDPIYPSHVAVAEALGYAKGVGVTAKIKPESWAATHAADHRT
jgi:predicted RNase H-related nuclease YkuK (DUF458 family)